MQANTVVVLSFLFAVLFSAPGYGQELPDTVSRDTSWQSRVRQYSAAVIRSGRAYRESLPGKSRTCAEVVLLEKARRERERVAREVSSPRGFSLRANLLQWAALTPSFGVEWRLNRDWGVVVDGAYTSWRWKDKARRYALWEVSPSVRRYLGIHRRWHAGLAARAGEFNRKLGTTGKQGDLIGGGITAGYRLSLNRRLSLSIEAGFGYVRERYDNYVLLDGTRVKRGKTARGRWGMMNNGIVLNFKF